jgi:hypothetical protein
MTGQIAYEAYRADAGGKSLATGAPIPEWDGLKSEIQHAWEAAAKAVMDASEMPELPCCPVHERLLKTGGTKPFDNCIVCIRNERDELRRQLAEAQAGEAEQYRAAHEAERQLADARDHSRTAQGAAEAASRRMAEMEGELLEARAVNETLSEACRFVKNFLVRLEDSLEADDPLRDIRRRYHAPLHQKLDIALDAAKGPRVHPVLAAKESN